MYSAYYYGHCTVKNVKRKIMKEITITRKEDGERLDRLLRRYLPGAGTGFLYRMIRKKNITVNAVRAEAAQRLSEGDIVRLYFSDETLEKFGTAITGAGSGTESKHLKSTDKKAASRKGNPEKTDGEEWPYYPLEILYKSEDVLFVNKPAGMLSQKAAPSDVSLCEYLIGYLLREGEISWDQLRLFRPSVCNRLDRGTSGIVACGTSIQGLQQLSTLIRERSVRKFYRALAVGHLQEAQKLDGFLIKDERTNTVRVVSKPAEGAKRITTVYTPLLTGKCGQVEWTYLEVELITGRSHQIRAHLASIGHPLLGDRRYGDRRINGIMNSRYGVHEQMLHAYRMEFPNEEKTSGTIARAMQGQHIIAPVPEVFSEILGQSAAP